MASHDVESSICMAGPGMGLALALVVSEESDLYADDNVGPVVLLCTGIVVGPGRCTYCPPRHRHTF
jgi:hypothetical protein